MLENLVGEPKIANTFVETLLIKSVNAGQNLPSFSDLISIVFSFFKILHEKASVSR